MNKPRTQADVEAAQFEATLLSFLDTQGASSYDPATGRLMIPDVAGDNSFLAARIMRENDETIADIRSRDERAAQYIATMERLIEIEVKLAQTPIDQREPDQKDVEHVTFAELMEQTTPGHNSAKGFDIVRMDYNGLHLFENYM